MGSDLRVLAIPGSLRRRSYNRRLLEAAVELAPPALEVTVVAHATLAAIPVFNADLEEGPEGEPEAVRTLRQQVRGADGVLISTPEYNQAVPGAVKNLVDWLSRPRPDEVLLDKPVAIMGATPGEWGTRLSQGMLRQILSSAEALVLPAGTALYVRHVDPLFDEAGELTDAETRRRLAALLEAFGAWIRRCRGGAG